MNSFLKYSLLLFAAGFLLLSSCRKEKITTNAADKLTFSVDTLRFDTVFTQRGSATRQFKVYNASKSPIVISAIQLGGGGSSFYRINVDGFNENDFPSSIITDVRIEAEDSIYVFTEVTIDPNRIDNALILMDSIIFKTNGNVQDVNLEAYGQDANYVGKSGEVLYYDCDTSPYGATWNPPKPYVVLGYMVLNCNLSIEAGTRVHFQGGRAVDMLTQTTVGSGNLRVGPSASLKVAGTVEAPVTFLTDRIEPEFVDVPGQWGGIILAAGSTDNEINYAEIRNSSIGILVDSAATLNISNSVIHETTSSGLISLHGSITASNCLIYDCGQYNVQLEYGGTHEFYNCTFANVGANPFLSHQEPVLRVSNYFVFEDENGNKFLFENDANVRFENCIIYGTRTDEIVLDNPDVVSAAMEYTFDHCLIKADTLDVSTGFLNTIINEDPLFVDPDELDYRLDSIISPAYNAGRASTLSGLVSDLDGNSRVINDTIDIGAFEFFE